MLKHVLLGGVLLLNATVAFAQQPQMSCGGTIPLNLPQGPIGSGGDGSGAGQRTANPRFEKPVVGEAPQPAPVSSTANRVTNSPAPYLIPVVFHWIVPAGTRWNTNYINTAISLANAQLDALNRDLGKANTDAGLDPMTGQPYKPTATSAAIPAWPVSTQPAIQFVPAKVRENGTCNTVTSIGGVTVNIPPFMDFVVGTTFSATGTDPLLLTPGTTATTGPFTGKIFQFSDAASTDNLGNADLDAVGMKVKKKSMGGANAWDVDHYLNIWVADVQYKITTCQGTQVYSIGSGYATPPTLMTPGSPDLWRDGVVINFRAVSGPGVTNPNALTYNGSPYWDNGRIGVHEVGHYFNLWHTWGDENCGSDIVGDTPRQENANGFGNSNSAPGFCSLPAPAISCYPANPNTSSCPGTSTTTQDMSMNYMDYTNDGCKNMFTKGQYYRMLETLLPGAARAKLLESRGLGFGVYTSQPVAVNASGTAGATLTVTFAPLASCLGSTTNYTIDIKKVVVVANSTNFTQDNAFTSADGSVSAVTSNANQERQFTVTFLQPAANYMVDIEINPNVAGIPAIHRRVRVYRTAYTTADIPSPSLSPNCSYVNIQPTRTGETITARFYNAAQSRTYTFNSLGGVVGLNSTFPAQYLLGFAPTNVRIWINTPIGVLSSPSGPAVYRDFSIGAVCPDYCPTCRPGSGGTAATNLSAAIATKRLLISPNPTSGGVRFSFDEQALPDGVITIKTLTGKEVRSFPVSEAQDSFNTSTLPDGAYLVEFRGADKVAHQTLIVQH